VGEPAAYPAFHAIPAFTRAFQRSRKEVPDNRLERGAYAVAIVCMNN